MKTNISELVFILDKSGSMSGLENDTIGGYNALLNKQREQPGEAIITTVLFDDNYEILHDRINIKGIRPITAKDYFVGGCTALLDAIGKTISKISKVQQHTSEDQRADKVMFVITTDGMENASQEYTYKNIKQMIEQQQKEHGWEFIFLGANIDSISTAARFGIRADRAANYHADQEGTLLNYEAISMVVSELRTDGHIKDNWKARIDEDFAQRKPKNRK